MCYDVDTDRFHVTVSLAAGREVSGTQRRVHNNVESLAGICIYLLARNLSQT